jgi:hypothetical protein
VQNNINITAIKRVRTVDIKLLVKRGTVLVDVGNEDLIVAGKSTLSVPADDSWIVVQPWENVIFVDENGEHPVVYSYMTTMRILSQMRYY